MKNYLYREKPVYRSRKASTTKIMRNVVIALMPIIIFAYYKNGLLPYLNGYGDFATSLRPLIMIFTGALTSVITEIIFIRLSNKNTTKRARKDLLRNSFAFFPGLFLALIVPYHTPYQVLILGAVVASVVGKLIFGGLGHNIFNPALVGGLIIYNAYPNIFGNINNYYNLMEADAVSGATPLTNLQSLNYMDSYQGVVGNYGNLWDFFFGFIPGSMAETSALLILIGFLYLLVKRVISYRIPVIYVSTVFILTSIISFNFGVFPWFPGFQVLSGGLLFGAVFMATDPVSSPVTPSGQVVYALGLGIMTVTLRFLTSYPEGVLTSILFMNMLTPLIDSKMGSYRHQGIGKILLVIISMLIAAGGITYYINDRINDTYIEELTPEDEVPEQGPVTLIKADTIDGGMLYTVTADGFRNDSIKAKVTVIDGSITTIEVLEHKESAGWGKDLVEGDYIQSLITNQNDLEAIDTVAGVTKTSQGLIDMIKFVKDEVIE